MKRRGDWIQTYSGLKIYPLDPKPEEICFDDIAHALSNICRFVGHCKKFYSVAQHSCYVSYYAKKENALWGLMHDASEAYLCDIARPIKRFLSGYMEAEEKLMKCIAERFGLVWPMPEEIKILDNRFLMTEARDLGLLSKDWIKYGEPFNIKITPLSPKQAERKMQDMYTALTWERGKIINQAETTQKKLQEGSG